MIVGEDGLRVPDAADNMHVVTAACTADAMKMKINDLQNRLEAVKHKVEGTTRDRKSSEAELAAATNVMCNSTSLNCS